MIRNLFDYNYVLEQLSSRYDIRDTLDVVGHPSLIVGGFDGERDTYEDPQSKRMRTGPWKYKFYPISLAWEFNALIEGVLKLDPDSREKTYLLSRGNGGKPVEESLWVSEIDIALGAYRFRHPSRTDISLANSLYLAWEQGGLFQ